VVDNATGCGDGNAMIGIEAAYAAIAPVSRTTINDIHAPFCLLAASSKMECHLMCSPALMVLDR
jgi:uncharacterized membrane protein